MHVKTVTAETAKKGQPCQKIPNMIDQVEKI